MKCDFWASLLARTFASPCLGREPKAKVATMTNYAKALSIGVDEFIVSLDPIMAPMRRSLCSMFLNPSNSMIPSSPSRCSFRHHH